MYEQKLKAMVGRFGFLLAVFFLVILVMSCTQRKNTHVTETDFSGSESCIECHANFYDLWSQSFHGKAMQPVNAGFVREYSLKNSGNIPVEDTHYEMVTVDSVMVMYEKEGDKILNTYPIEWSLGGHNVFCFLTPLDKGKLQTIPLAYDMNRETWFNYPESAVRHFVEEEQEDEALPWKDAMYTFNTGCYSCHVSQLSTNFDLQSETYSTTWREAGINCETCHGPGGEHIKIFKNLKEGEEAENVGLIVTTTFTQEQHNASCAPCHAKMNPITPSYMPGDKFFDNYNITTLEDPDFYPDGRDLGENYTMTGWMMNPCLPESEIHCVTCHTSSGRDRNKNNPNNSCLQCHTEIADEMEAHTLHKPEDGLTCLSCHMPKREFVGHFLRSDHSFRPPMPEATIRFGSPNACNQCHTDKSPQWANEIVKKSKNKNYQDATLKWAQLIAEARNRNWENIDKMYSYINEEIENEVVTTSFIRLLANYNNESKVDVLIDALNSESELVRAAAATGLSGYTSDKVKNALIKACTDEIRLVRINAASSILVLSDDRFTAEEKTVIKNAENEYVTSMTARPDNWSAHYNLGIYHQNKGDVENALASYETAARLYPPSLMPLINSSVLYSYIGNTAKAEENLKKAVEQAPENEAANLNLGLLLAELGKLDEAEKALKTALQANPEQAVAAYNLSVIVSQKNIGEAVGYAEIAANANPDDPKYAYTLAFYQAENGQKNLAISRLKKLIEKHPDYLSAVSFLAELYLQENKKEQAIQVYENALKIQGLSQQDRAGIQQAINTLQM